MRRIVERVNASAMMGLTDGATGSGRKELRNIWTFFVCTRV